MGFISGRIKSIYYAIKGAFTLITTEHSIMVQTGVSLIAVFLGFFFNITREEWMAQILAIGMVLSIEGLNTAVEGIADFIHPDFHTKIGYIKDIAAGAVFFIAMAAVAVGCIIYYPYVSEYLN